MSRQCHTAVPNVPAAPAGPPRSARADEASRLLDQAYEEFVTRWEAGEDIDPEAFCARFAQCRTRLRRLMCAHHSLDRNLRPVAGEASPSVLKPGDRFLHFWLRRELGRGTFSRVFLAADADLGGRLVVLKVTGRDALEAQTLGRLIHPHVIPVHSVQHDPLSGLTAVCMPFLGSATLTEVLGRAFARPGQFPKNAGVILDAARDADVPAGEPAAQAGATGWWARASYIDAVVGLGAQLADALAFIHAQGVCHHDLKPSNVLITPQGRPLLLDFNLSKDTRFAWLLMGGTMPYMAPEQLLAFAKAPGADPAALDARCDVFSLGVILYELLSGRHPFGAIPLRWEKEQDRALLSSRHRAGPPPLRRLAPHIPRALACAIEACLAFDPAGRPQRAGDLVAALRACLARARRARRLRGGFLAAGAALALALAGLWLQPAPGPSRVDCLQQGRAAYEESGYDRALNWLGQALRADPNDAEALFLRGRVYQRQGDIHRAKVDFQRARDLAPRAETAACLGYCLSGLGEHTSAAARYTEAIQGGFGPAEVFNNLGYSYLQNGCQWQKARPALDQAIRKNPRLQAAFHNRALCLFNEALHAPDRKGPALKAAIADVQQALRLGPRTPELYGLAQALYEKAREVHGGPALEQAIRSCQKDAQLLGDELTRRRVPRACRLIDPLAGHRRNP